ncbi:hypothetical protein O4215_20705 [Rhodococcus maanshanensis]|uniref:phage tail tube protein n=1 Tax=Rhodococcus maanshanensis TaxID=183556 RepID=UPI0022B2F25C|nr:hypothetical protein [Rhodococcus maanshanensis]MCZ4557986.1 hypothetical protein [Rhodococcus maanshanensis]
MPTTEPLLPKDSSTLLTTLARDWAVQVNTSTTATPSWVFVYGLSKVSPTQEISMQDDADIHAGGYKSQIATAIGANLDLEGLRKGEGAVDDAITPDPGQEFLRAKGEMTGSKNVAHVRYWRTDSLPDSYEHTFTVGWKDTGGDKEALQGFSCTLTGRGKPKKIAKPTVTTP